MGRKGRARVLMDQKANSVADMAAVLLGQGEVGEGEVGGGDEGRGVGQGKGKGKGRRKGGAVEGDGDGDASRGKVVAEGEREVRGVQGVRIAWSNILDAQFAQTWPASVVHADLRTDRYTAPDPMAEVGEMEPRVEAVATL